MNESKDDMGPTPLHDLVPESQGHKYHRKQAYAFRANGRQVKCVKYCISVDDLLRDLDVTEGILRMKWTQTFNKISTANDDRSLANAADEHGVIWSSQPSK